jgi:predicted RNA binding protein YcfA (HicA-like mRNA interferase family)
VQPWNRLASNSEVLRLQWKLVKVRDLIRRIESDGWQHVRTTGSHRHFKHATKPNVVTVPGHAGDDVPLGTLKSVLKAAELEAKK